MTRQPFVWGDHDGFASADLDGEPGWEWTPADPSWWHRSSLTGTVGVEDYDPQAGPQLYGGTRSMVAEGTRR